MIEELEVRLQLLPLLLQQLEPMQGFPISLLVTLVQLDQATELQVWWWVLMQST